jgi:cyclopropane-fatty-acyl-phospholipid synthase
MTTPKKKVAVVGGGVSGLSAAWHLAVNAPNAEVVLFEASDRLGGHAYTVPVELDDESTIDVDIGFMVFNDANYPNMVEWHKSLGDDGIQHEDSDMSLSVSLDKGDTLEWTSSAGLNGFFAKRGQIFDSRFRSMVRDMTRFHKEAPKLLLLHEDDPRKHVTTHQYLKQNGYSEGFGVYYLLPMMAALWSSSMNDVLDFPAAQLIGFLCNHKMLQLFGRPQWKTVQGRSQTYTNKVGEILGEKRVRTSTPIVSIKKMDGKNQYGLFAGATSPESVGLFDEVIFACHTDTAASILKAEGSSSTIDRMDQIIDHLEQIEYSDNVVYLHSDPKLMPQRRRAWASWNCLGDSEKIEAAYGTKKGSKKSTNTNKHSGAFEGAESGFGNTQESTSNSNDEVLEGKDGRMKSVYVTYWLNRLQNLDKATSAGKEIFVSLNPHEPPEESLVHKRTHLAHPQFTPATMQARKALKANHQGQNGLWFCGAWQGYGFHEDGCRSGFDVATALSGVPLPWAKEDGAEVSDSDETNKALMVLPPPNLVASSISQSYTEWISEKLFHDLPIALCKRFLLYFLKAAVQQGKLRLRFNDGRVLEFGDGTPCGLGDAAPVTLRVFDDWLFVKIAWEFDLGLARSYMAGHFVVESLEKVSDYNPVLRPAKERDETTLACGDPSGITRLLLLLIGNRDRVLAGNHVPNTSAKGYSGANPVNAGPYIISKIGSFLNFLRYRLTMDNSEKGGSLKNIHAHYDLSNDLFTSFLDKETLMYSSAIYDAIKAPAPQKGLVFRGTLEQAQWRKLDTLLDRAQVQPGQEVLDIGFGWGGLSLHAAKKYGCKVTGITLSVEQRALALKRVEKEGLGHLITFEVMDYRTFCRKKENSGRFDRVLSCEMIEAVGHDHLPEFYWAVEQVLAPDGILVMEAITTTEERYENYLRSTDFINTVIFPGSCCPCLHALVDAAYKGSRLTLEHIDNIGLHYAQTLADWRRRFNANEALVKSLGFDDIFLRAWNYYLSYCEAGFYARNVNCLILVFSRNGCTSLAPLYETRACTQFKALTEAEVTNWISEA